MALDVMYLFNRALWSSLPGPAEAPSWGGRGLAATEATAEVISLQRESNRHSSLHSPFLPPVLPKSITYQCNFPEGGKAEHM